MARPNRRPLRDVSWLCALAVFAGTGCLVVERDSPCGEHIPYCGELLVADLGCPADGRVACCRWDDRRDDWVVQSIRLDCTDRDVWEPLDRGQDAGPAPDVPVDVAPQDGLVDLPPEPGNDPGLDAPPDVPPDAPLDAADVADADLDVPPLPASLVLDPDSLSFFGLPIDSIRFAVSGHDPDARVCVTLVWDFSNTGRTEGPFCDDFGPGFPYAIVHRDTDGPCGGWAYGGTVDVVASEGCLDMAGFGPTSMDFADIRATLETGDGQTVVTVDNRDAFPVPPVFFGLSFVGETPRDAWVQTGDDFGLPTWVSVREDGVPFVLYDRCDVPVCGDSSGVCGIAWHRVVNVTDGGASGTIWQTWDGHRREIDETGMCWERVAAPSGTYTARFCYGDEVSEVDIGPDVLDPHCTDVEFTMPTDRVELQVSFEG